MLNVLDDVSHLIAMLSAVCKVCNLPSSSLVIEQESTRYDIVWPHYKRPASISVNCSQGSVLTSDSNSHDELHRWISIA